MIKYTRIPIPENYSFKETLSFLDRGYDDCLYHLSNQSVSRLIHLSGRKGLITIRQEGESLRIIVQKDKVSTDNLQAAKDYVTEWFDIERDIQPFYSLLDKHPQLSGFPKAYYGSRLIGIPALFEAICWAIIGQQINLTFAYQVKRSLVEQYGEKEIIDNQTYYLFPTPAVLAKADENTLRALKFSRQKITYLKTISNAFLNNEMSHSILFNCKNKEKRIEKLTAIKGIGIWTANYVLMKTMRDQSCITYGDSGLNKAMHLIFNIPKKPSKDEVDTIFKDFKGWESYLNFYLWKSL